MELSDATEKFPGDTTGDRSREPSDYATLGPTFDSAMWITQMQNVSAESINVLGSTTNNSDLRLNDFG
jgi:hypothetical protein